MSAVKQPSGKELSIGKMAKKHKVDKKKIENAVRDILVAIGENPGRGDLVDTPARVANMYEEIFSGMWMDPAAEVRMMDPEKYDQIVLVKNIPFYSMCEHHMLPFIGKCHVAYIPEGGRVTGLSKLVRVTKVLSRRLQVQERLTAQIAAVLMDTLKPKGVMVVIEAEHLCMSMRGVQEAGTCTVTSAVRGIFRTNRATREETLALIRKGTT